MRWRKRGYASEREYLSKAGMRGNKPNGWDTGEAAERCEGMKIWRRWRANTAEQESGHSGSLARDCQGDRPPAVTRQATVVTVPGQPGTPGPGPSKVTVTLQRPGGSGCQPELPGRRRCCIGGATGSQSCPRQSRSSASRIRSESTGHLRKTTSSQRFECGRADTPGFQFEKRIF